MRIRDVVALALLALWQRKLRAALTTLGVAVGCFVLIASLSIGQGVEGVIFRQLRKQDQLRRVYVWPGGGPRPELPPQALEVGGDMSPARRGRLREAIRRRWKSPPTKPGQGLTPAQLDTLAKLPHVESVTPALIWNGEAVLGGKRLPGQIRVAAPDDAGLSARLLAGRLPDPADPDGVIVSEYLAYRWGYRNEADVPGLLGRRVRLEVSQPQPGVGGLLLLLNVGRAMTEAETRLLQKVLTRLPMALEGLELSEAERVVLLRLLKESRPGVERKVGHEGTVIGVFRDVARQELSPWDGPPRPVDVLVAGPLAERLYFAVPTRKGLPAVVLRVEDERHLREVHERVKALGMDAFSLAEAVEQVRLTVLLGSIASTFVAAVALAVAALGIMNTMLMSVLERTHEIGVMKATGARDGQVQALFLTEGALVGVVGGLFGLLAAWLLSFPGDGVARAILEKQTQMQLTESVFAYPAWLVVGVPALVVVLTTLASVYPARRAARVDPITALRQR